MTIVASNYARKENDFYQTEPWATEALLRRFPVAGLSVWEPAAGNHLMADVLRDSAAKVWTSDIATYDRQHDCLLNFFSSGDYLMRKSDAIVTNPPYGKSNREAVKFTRLALQRCRGLVAMLLTMKFDSGKTRYDLFGDNPRFAAKIVLTDRISWEFNGKGGTENHAWYVWQGVRSPGIAPVIYYEGRG